jgi:surface polysaccharide O-acyltransferase-like enzyme
VLVSNPRILELITRRRREFLVGGLAVAVLFFWMRAAKAQPGLIAWNLVSGYFGMLWIFALVGYARFHIREANRWLSYATEAVYPFYIVHQTITIAIVYHLLPWHAGVWVKFAIAAVGTFAGSWLCFELVKRTAVTRVLFGLKPRAAEADSPVGGRT